MKIVVLDGYTLCQRDVTLDALCELGEVEFYDRTAAEQVARRIGDAPVVLTNKARITREVMEACPALRYIGVLATGYNVVDVDAARERGIVVTNVPGYSTQAVAQHTMALLLAGMSRVHDYDVRVKQGDWAASPDFCFFAAPMQEIAGKTLGVVGFGSIGQAVTRAALALGMRVAVHTRTMREEYSQNYPDVKFVGLDALLTCSDVITLHCPLTEKTQNLLDGKAIAKMKRGVFVINTARGPLVDETAMADALREGQVALYMADVLSIEPPSADHPLLHSPHTIITPHVAWAARQTRERLRDEAVKNVAAFLAGEPRNVV